MYTEESGFHFFKSFNFFCFEGGKVYTYVLKPIEIITPRDSDTVMISTHKKKKKKEKRKKKRKNESGNSSS